MVEKFEGATVTPALRLPSGRVRDVSLALGKHKEAIEGSPTVFEWTWSR